MTRSKIIGWYQLVGGLIGLIHILFVWFANRHKLNIEYFILPMLLLFLLLLITGIFLITAKKKYLSKGVLMSISLLFFQIIGFAIQGIEFKFNIGAFLGFIISNNYEIQFYPFLLDYKLSVKPNESYISLNLIPIVLSVLLYQELDR